MHKKFFRLINLALLLTIIVVGLVSCTSSSVDASVPINSSRFTYEHTSSPRGSIVSYIVTDSNTGHEYLLTICTNSSTIIRIDD